MEDFGVTAAIRPELLNAENNINHPSTQFGRLTVRAISQDSVFNPVSGAHKSTHIASSSAWPAHAETLLSPINSPPSSDDFKAIQATDVTGALKELNLTPTGNMLGRGAYSVVEEWFTNDDKPRAVKRILPEKYLTNYTGLETGEVCALDFSNHPNLVKVHTILVKMKNLPVYAAVESRKQLTDRIKKHCHLAAVISDKASGKELFRQLCDKHFQRTNLLITNLGNGAAGALSYLNGKGVIHQDIKPENILFDPETNEVKIVDYGFFNDPKLLGETGSLKGTPEYMAPEIWQIYYLKNATCNIQYDAWGLGCLLLECITGKNPVNYHKFRQNLQEKPKSNELFKKSFNINAFSKLNDHKKMQLILNYSTRTMSEEINPDLIDITVKLLRAVKKERMTTDEAKKQLSELLLKLKKK